ncbi:MAG: hypothetical protein AAGG48_17140 [Planctomycetota bacterium]
MFRHFLRKRTRVPLGPRSDGFVPDASFWRALELVMGQYLDEEPRHHDGPSTDLYELTVCKSLCTLDHWCEQARQRDWFSERSFE